MKVVFLVKLYSPHLGGVEKHTQSLVRQLSNKGFNSTIITQRYQPLLPSIETIDGNTVLRINYPKLKFAGLLYIWFWMIMNIKYYLEADIIHIHDVFIWYLPIRIILFYKPVYITHHGWEGTYPIPIKNILYKKLANYLSKGSIAIGHYISKYYGIKPTLTFYGGIDNTFIKNKKRAKKNLIAFLGRLDTDTGIQEFLKFIDKNKSISKKIVFIGDGKYKELCQKYGDVVGFINPLKYLKNSRVVFTSGYMSILESFAAKVKVYVSANNNLKKDYYNMSPFRHLLNYINETTLTSEFLEVESKKINSAFKLSKNFNSERLVNTYLSLWNLL